MFSYYFLVQVISVLITVDCYIPYNPSDGHSWKIYLNNHGNCGQYSEASFIGVLMKRYSENTQQIYRRTPMPQCDFNKVAKQVL